MLGRAAARQVSGDIPEPCEINRDDRQDRAELDQDLEGLAGRFETKEVADQQGISLDAGAEWWWPNFPIGPTAVWVIGALAYAALLVVLWPQLRRKVSAISALD